MTAETKPTGAPAQVIKKPAKEKAEKPALKAVDLNKPVEAAKADEPAGEGHNSPLMIPAVVDLMLEDEKLEEQIKLARKAQADIRTKAKTEFNILKQVWNEEKKLRKMDREVREQRESGLRDLQGMLGYQASLFEVDQPETAAGPAAAAAKHATKH